MSGLLEGLVDSERWEIHRSVFTDEALYRRELSEIFGRQWLYVGHESQIPSPGDFFLSKMGEDLVILTRDRSGTIRVLLNSCRHRGMQVCRYDEGATRQFFCPYHAWAYDLDGRLAAVPQEEHSFPIFDKGALGLLQPAQVQNFRGLIWANWDPKAPSFDDYLGETRDWFWNAFGPWDGGDGEVEAYGGVLKWIVPSNWKLVSENFTGDALHEPSHASVNRVNVGPGGAGRRDSAGEIFMSHYPQGHGVIWADTDLTKPLNHYQMSPATSEYYERCWERRKARLGEKARFSPYLGNIFPNAAFHTQQPRTILAAHPLGPNRTEMWRTFFVDKDAPAEVKDFLRKYYMTYAGPAGMTEQDDMENWGYAHASCLTHESGKVPFQYQAGREMEGAHPHIPGTVAINRQSEQNGRNFYRRWLELVSAGDAG